MEMQDKYNNYLENDENYYLMYSNFKKFKNKIRETEDVIKTILLKDNIKCYVSFSGGKDSLVLLHLLLKFNPKIKVIFFNSGAEFPDTLEFIKILMKEWKLNFEEIYPRLSILEIHRRIDSFGYESNTKQYELANKFKEILVEEPAKILADRGYNTAFMGLRKEESKNRMYALNRFGSFFYCKTAKINHCNPLSDWSGKDIWAYIFSNNLKYNKIYDKKWIVSREKLRVSSYAGCTHSSIKRGRWAFIKKHYPDVWNKFANEFPFVKSYC